MSDEPSVEFLEQKAAAIRARLNPAAADAAVQQERARLSAKYTQEFGIEPAEAMLAQVGRRKAQEYDAALAADVAALKDTYDIVVTTLDREIAAAQEVPDEATYFASQRRPTGMHAGGLTLAEETGLRTLEHLQRRDLHADLQGASFSRLEHLYESAVAREDRVALRVLEEQARQGWPMATAPTELDTAAQLRLGALIDKTRTARIPADKRDAHARVKKLWNASLDMHHRNLTRGLKVAGR